MNTSFKVRRAAIPALLAFCLGGASCASVLGLDDVTTADSSADGAAGAFDASLHPDGAVTRGQDGEATVDATASDAPTTTDTDGGDDGEDAGPIDGIDYAFVCPDAGQAFHFDFRNGFPDAAITCFERFEDSNTELGAPDEAGVPPLEVTASSSVFSGFSLFFPANYFDVRPLSCFMVARFFANETNVTVTNIRDDVGDILRSVVVETDVSGSATSFSSVPDGEQVADAGSSSSYYRVGFKVSPADASMVNLRSFAVDGATDASVVVAPRELQVGAFGAYPGVAIAIEAVECMP